MSEMHEKLRVSLYVFSQIVNERSRTNGHCGYGMQYNARQIQKEYEERHEDIPLSVIYSKCGCPGLRDFHKIVEVLSLLCSRRGLWAFLYIKIATFLKLNHHLNGRPAYWVFRMCSIVMPIDKNDVSFLWEDTSRTNVRQQTELETEFYQTIDEIQTIIGWKEFANRVREIIHSIKNTDYRAQWRRFWVERQMDWRWVCRQFDNDFRGFAWKKIKEAVNWCFAHIVPIILYIIPFIQHQNRNISFGTFPN